MPNWKKVSEEDKKDMIEMFEAGMSVKEVSELTGWAKQTVYDKRRNWKKRRSEAKPEVAEEAETEQEVQTGLENSDYAKSYLAGDPAVVHSSFEISRNVRIRSKKTGILYEMDDGNPNEKIIKITLADGKQIDIELGLFEKFVDEGVDVFLELKRTA